MITGQFVGLIWGAGALVLVGAALLARRVPGAAALRMAAIWIGIFALTLLAVSFFDRARRAPSVRPAPLQHRQSPVPEEQVLLAPSDANPRLPIHPELT